MFSQIWLTMSDGTLLDCCYARAYGSLSGSGRGGILDGGVREDQGSARSSTGCVLFCNPNAGFWESTVMSGEGSRNW